eukprot:1753535-Ditylum_brightwellii.AAC.1
MVSGKASPPKASRADFFVRHNVMGMINNSSPSLILRLANNPRPLDSLVISSTVSVDMAIG